MVTSYSTRKPRDDFDKTTHTFVGEDYYEAVKEESLTTYTAPSGYHNWVDETLLHPNKINLYAIDTKAIENEFYPKCKEKGWNLKVIYLEISDEERLRRYIKREGTKDGFSNEDHLGLEHLKHTPKQVINVEEDGLYDIFKNICLEKEEQ